MRQPIAAAALLAALCACEVSIGGGNNAAAAGEEAAPEPAAAPRMARFVNSRANARSDALRQHYVDFSFQFPLEWTVSPQPEDGSARNYVRVAAPLVDGYEPFAFHVGYAYGSGDAESDARDLERTLPQIAQQFGSTMPGYRLTSMGRDDVGQYETFNWRFSATAPGVDGGKPAEVYGRGDIILPPGATRGVLLISLVTDRTEEAVGPAEVGESGTLEAIFDSFRLGGTAAGSQEP